MDYQWRVLISAPYMLPVLDQYREQLHAAGVEIVTPPQWRERLEEEDLLLLLRDIDGVMCGDDRFTEAVFAAAPRLKVISKWGTGIDSIDTAAAEHHGITVYNTPNAFSGPVADTVWGYLLCCARQLLAMDRAMRDGTWQKVPAVMLRECTLGVIGVGNVGKEVVRRAEAFGIRVLGNDRVEMPADFLATTNIEMVTLSDILARADFLSLNCDLNPTSQHLMSTAEFQQMKRTAYLINTCRGPVVDEPALVYALQTGEIAGAALDVFEEEPLPADSPLRRLENCLLAPHNANSSPTVAAHVHEQTIRNLLRGLRMVEA